MSQLSIVICILLSLIAVASAVTVIDPAQFDEQVVKSDHAWLIKFYSKMCGACNDFKPTWKKVTGKLKDFSFGEISIDDKAGMKLAEKLGVLDEGLPNVRMFYQNGDKNGVSVATGNLQTFTAYQ